MIANQLKMAGYGLTPATNSPLNCTTLTYDTTGITDISPVTIIDGGTSPGASDSLKIRYGTSGMGGVPSTIKGNPSGNVVTVENNLSCRKNDIVMMISGTTCNLTYVKDDITDTTTLTLNDVTGDVAAVDGARLACLGSWVTTEFQVNPSYNPTDAANSQAYLDINGEPSVADIVNIQAQYGISNSGSSNQITDWVNATDGQASGDWGPGITVANRNRIKAVRIAVVARNGLLEKDEVTSACSSTTAASPTGLCAWDATSAAPPGSASGTNFPAPSIDLSNDPNWKRYRYRVFETIIPLRNMIWTASTL
jgi:type IV pilus assembly protein PilW